METLTFKTNINCSSCVAKATDSLNESAGKGNWTVDTTNPDKVLTVKGEQSTERKIIELLEKAGFKAKSIHQS